MTPRLVANEARAVADQFGVALEQVRRDHVISIVLTALASDHADDLIFFGGTALSRTHLPDGRLSEDIDLLSLPPRQVLAPALMRTIERSLRLSHGRVTWNPALDTVREVDPGVLTTDDGLTVRIQLLRADRYPPWPTERRRIEQRYSDVGPATLEVHTLEAFVASKTVAWYDRRSSRDLFDLYSLGTSGGITPAAGQLFARLGPTGNPPSSSMFADLPADGWVTALAAQTRLTVEPEDALRSVRESWQYATTA